MKDTCVIYPVYNRLEYVMLTLPALIYDCRHSKYFKELLIIDDMSVDGTTEFVKSFDYKKLLGGVKYVRRKVGSSTMQWNMAKEKSGAEYFANFTNENLISMGTIDALRAAHKEDTFGISGILSGNTVRTSGVVTSFPYVDENITELEEKNFLGCGVFKREVFDKLGDVPVNRGDKKYFGFTGYQAKARAKGWRFYVHKGVRLVRLDESSIYSRCDHYIEKGWARDLNRRDSIFNEGFNTHT